MCMANDYTMLQKALVVCTVSGKNQQLVEKCVGWTVLEGVSGVIAW